MVFLFPTAPRLSLEVVQEWHLVSLPKETATPPTSRPLSSGQARPGIHGMAVPCRVSSRQGAWKALYMAPSFWESHPKGTWGPQPETRWWIQ
jgi:hypothetical protein